MRSSTSSFKRWLPAIAVGVSLVAVFWAPIYLQLGYSPRNAKTEPWLSDVARVREVIYQQQPAHNAPVIWIVGGSNALFGLSSETISSITGYPVRNYALHAGLHPDLLFAQIATKVNAGDLVVAPIEFGVVDRELGNVFDIENYLHHYRETIDLSIWQRYQLFTSVPLKRWALGSYTQWFDNEATRYSARETNETLVAEWRDQQADTVYSHASLNEFGDINVSGALVRDTWVDGSASFPPAPIGERGVALLDRWSKHFQDRGARFMLVLPILLQSSRNSLLDANAWSTMERYRATLAASLAPLHCDPADAVYAAVYRFNTLYHPNATGAVLRSRALAHCIAGFLNGEDTTMPPIEPQTMAARIRERFTQQREHFGQGELAVQTRLRDIHAIQQALENYYREHQRYPPSSNGADRWGIADGLAPHYLAAYPLDPLGAPKSERDPHYAYFSNGRGYKLVAVPPLEDCVFVAANWPKLIDPARIRDGDPTLCAAFGYWTDDLRDQ